MLRRICRIIYPPKCALCEQVLPKNQTDFCNNCRENAQECEKAHFRISFLAGWTAVWYYKDTVRMGLIRYKFRHRRVHAFALGRKLAMKLQTENLTDFDILTFAPIAPLRKARRGYDQVALLAKAVGKELGVKPCRTLRKIRNTPPQSGITDPALRRANVLGAYKAVAPELIRGKRVLLLEDIITTGATASECARVLLTAGAKEVYCAALAVSNYKNSR